jgi:hypothetical protein
MAGWFVLNATKRRVIELTERDTTTAEPQKRASVLPMQRRKNPAAVAPLHYMHYNFARIHKRCA